MKIIEVDQNRPYDLMKNRFFRGNQYKELLYIAKKNQPDLTVLEIIEMFKKLSKTGCSAAMIANIIGEKVYINDNDFKEKFGFSLSDIDGQNIDYNKILVDVYSKLYNVAKVKFIKYDEYEFKSAKEAAKNLLKKEFNKDFEAILELFNSGYSANGYSKSGNLLFKKRVPKISEYVGNASEISENLFGINGVKTFEGFKEICSDKNIEIQISDLEIYEKLTGLGTNNFNFWMNYYFNKYNLDFTFYSEGIIINDFNNNYRKIQNYILNLISEGYSISVSAGPNKEVYIHNNKAFSWMKITNDKAGHVMLFKSFDQNEDIVVSSYGKDYIIPKEYFNQLELNKIKKEQKQVNKINNVVKL